MVVVGPQPALPSSTTVGANWIAAPPVGVHVSVAPSSRRICDGPIQLTRSPGTADALVTAVMSKSGRVMAFDWALPVNVNDMVPAASTVAAPVKLPPDRKVTPVIRSVSAGFGSENVTFCVGMAWPVAGVVIFT
jgi:hypothetical protein